MGALILGALWCFRVVAWGLVSWKFFAFRMTRVVYLFVCCHRAQAWAVISDCTLNPQHYFHALQAFAQAWAVGWNLAFVCVCVGCVLCVLSFFVWVLCVACFFWEAVRP